MHKRLIIAIVGASGAGKTQLILWMNRVNGVPFICSYTTRPMREGEIDGVDHKFVTEDDMPDHFDMLAYTYFGENHYWATHEQVDDLLPTLYAIDEAGLLELKEKWGNEYEIISVYINRPNNDVDQERQERDKCRVHIDKDLYDLNVVNDYPSLEEFQKSVSRMVFDLLRKRHRSYIFKEMMFDGRMAVAGPPVDWRLINPGDVVLEGIRDPQYRTITAVYKNRWEYFDNEDKYYSETSAEYCHWLVRGQRGCRGGLLIPIEYSPLNAKNRDVK